MNENPIDSAPPPDTTVAQPPVFGRDTVDSLKPPSKTALDKMMRTQGAGGYPMRTNEPPSIEAEDLILINEEIPESEKPLADEIIQTQSASQAQNSQERTMVFSIRKIPQGIILTDRDTGEEAERTRQEAFMLGYWERPPQGNGPSEGPALFVLEAMFPDGLRGKRVDVRRKLEIKRRGLLWDGQTSEDLERIKRERERRKQSPSTNS